MSAFANEPVLELRRAPVRAGLDDALRKLDAELPLQVPVWVGNERRRGDALRSLDPCHSDRVVAEAAAATPDEVDRALELAAGPGFRKWSATPAAERAATLRRAAQILRDGRLRAAAMAVRECGKPWPEADADVCEAIDFLEFYARGAVELDKGAELLQVPGERNELRYAPRGVVAVISPWNFPLAIPLGMAAAGLATGNAVLLKPAEQAPGCALILAEALREAGVPPEAFALLPGEGDVGAALVKDPRVHTIAFTGSNAVGLEIVRVAAEVQPGQKHLKRVVAEMGGKNCVIVDSDADLDEVVPGLVQSAFNYAGQKCSAAARVLVHQAGHDELLERLAGAVEVLEVGPAERLGIDLPAVIEQEALDRHARFAALGAREGRIVARAAGLPDGGFYASPTLVADLPEGSELLTQEIFAPLLTVEAVRSVDEACDRVDASSFALTGGLFARNPETVERVIARSPVGNLYVNRAITGAMVARQPFGGNRL
ncbi:MAG: RHH-type transcriptional regulator, proline utilization regulon repressor / proline dehydrogenase, partial [Solirubrobacteraceae bacterium]|nr:RHH-type transcriptional regulator, proline utilization regulon repressor / proline dehydrogenase [Solirubrobacteraceae bacterium]